MIEAIRCWPGGYVVYVGVALGVELPGEELFLSHVQPARRPSPGPPVLPELIDLIWKRTINAGKVFDFDLPLDQAADGYRAMDERRLAPVVAPAHHGSLGVVGELFLDSKPGFGVAASRAAQACGTAARRW